jgi:hypothetical protein
MKLFALIPISLALALTSTANCATIIGTLTATVTSIDKNGSAAAPSGMSVGSTVTLSFSYDSLALPDGTRGGFSGDPNIAEYGSGLNLSITATSEGYNWSGEHNNGYAVVMNGGFGANDRFEVEVRRSYGGTFNSFVGDLGGDLYLAFALSDIISPLTLTSSLALPVSQFDLNLAAAHNNGIVISSQSLVGGDSWTVFAAPNVSSLVITPEPSYGLLVLGSSSFLLLRRRRF